MEQDGKALRLVVDGKLAPLLSPATQRDLKALARHLGLSPETQSVSAN